MRLVIAMALLLGACGGAEPIAKATSPLGCWHSLSGHAELDLRAGGGMQFLDGDTARIVAGTWSYEATRRELVLSTEPSAWQVTDLTPAEMWTDNGTITHWQSIACQ